MKLSVSGVVLTKNEEKNILDCIASLDWCDEIVVVDDYSEDKTLELIDRQNNKKIRVFQRSLKGDFSAQRNFGLEKAQGEWIFFVDADERVSASVVNEISHYVNSPSIVYTGFLIKRIDFMWGKELRHGEIACLKFLRLARKNSGKWEGKVHEKWHVKGNIGKLSSLLIHYPHHTLSDFLQEINIYTSIRAEELYKKGVKTNWWGIILFPSGKFLINYFFKLGILDGLPGLVFAITMSMHSFLVRGKLWQLWQNSPRLSY